MTGGSGYAPGGAISVSAGVSNDKKTDAYWPLSRCKKAYLDYLGNKTEEINEQKDARRYYHGAQWTEDQLKVLRKRRQPPSTKNRIARKIDGTIGLIERLKQGPKAFPRTQQQEQGAELATAVIRYLLDAQEWNAKTPECARDAAVDGIGGIEVEIEKGDHGDPDIGFEIVEPDSFFYDPRSYRADFSDSRFMGLGKWVDIETAKDMFPDKEDEIGGLSEDGSELSSQPDREQKWFSFDGSKKLVRLVDIWYKHKGGWCWAIFTGSVILMEGQSYLKDEKGKPSCKYIMFSCNVDHDGDRYGFVRHMKSSQDSFNFKHSKLNHILASRRLIINAGSVPDVEKARTEWARDDGVIVVNGNVNEQVKADDRTFDFAGWAKLLEEDKAELDNYGPNQALIGDLANQSGRAIQLLQQAGMSELGPYILGYRGWKIRVYRALFSAAQEHWKAERWIRVTDDQELAQFIQINGVGVDPQTGYPTMVNALGSLDVDIIMDEGPDTINAQQDVYETLSNVLPTVGRMLPPQLASTAVEILIDNSALPASSKKKFRDASQEAAQAPPPPNPEVEKAKIQLEAKQQDHAMELQKKAQEHAIGQDAEAKKAQQDMALKAAEAEQEMAIKQREADQEYANKQREADLELAIERAKAEQQLHVESKKADMGLEVDRIKSERGLQVEKSRGEMSLEVAKKQGDMKTDKAADKAEKPAEHDKRVDALSGEVEKILKAVADLSKQIKMPKKLIRDANGDIIGSRLVEKI